MKHESVIPIAIMETIKGMWVITWSVFIPRIPLIE